MPREWHDRHSVNQIEDPERRRFYQEIVADKKPYFMRYIYPALMRQYNTYIKNTNKNALREFQMTVYELMEIPQAQLTERQSDFLRYYHKRMPVGTNDCVMNRVCRRFEREFDGYLGRRSSETEFDYTVMKSGAEYTRSQYNAIEKLYRDYNRRLQNYVIFSSYERVDKDEAFSKKLDMRSDFIKECSKVCPNRYTLCDIVLDICYTKSASKRFAWEICGDEIIMNLLRRNGGSISLPVIDQDGDIEYGGETFSLRKIRLEESDEYCS